MYMTKADAIWEQYKSLLFQGLSDAKAREELAKTWGAVNVELVLVKIPSEWRRA